MPIGLDWLAEAATLIYVFQTTIFGLQIGLRVVKNEFLVRTGGFEYGIERKQN